MVISLHDLGWWRVDAQGLIGWAPASYLVPVNESDLQEEAEENEHLIEQERGKAHSIVQHTLILGVYYSRDSPGTTIYIPRCPFYRNSTALKSP